MYRCAMDAEESTMVVRWSGRTISADEYEAGYRDTCAFIAATAPDKPALILVIVGRDCPRPNAAERQRFAGISEGLAERQVFNAFVTESPISRGVLTAIQWLRPRRDNHADGRFAALPQAMEWIEAVAPSHAPCSATLVSRVYEPTRAVS